MYAKGSSDGCQYCNHYFEDFSPQISFIIFIFHFISFWIMICAPAARAFHFFFPKKRNETKKIRQLRSETFSLKPRRLFISFPRRKETKQRKFAGYVPEAKICTFFLKKKNSLTLKQLFLFNEKSHKFLHASPLMSEVSEVDVY